MNLLDHFKQFASALPAFDPIAAIHEAISPSRARTAINSIAQDGRRDVPRFSRQQLVAISRKLSENDGIARAFNNEMARYSIGQGLIAQAKTESEDWNSSAEDYFREWSKVADVQGKMHFNRMQRVLSIAMDRDGDVGLLLTKSATGLPQVQLIEGHRIGDGTEPIGRQPDGSEWFDGVKVSPDGKALAYRIVTQDVNGMKTVQEVDASNFILLFDPQRADQVRGYPAIACSANNHRDRKDILDFEKIGQKRDASMWAKLKTASGEADPADWDSEEITVDGKKITYSEARGGEVKVLASDEELEPWQSNRPSPTFTGFLDHIIRDISASRGLPFEFIWNPERLSGTSQRFVLEKAQRAFRERQDLLITGALNRIWFWVISVGIKRGDLQMAQGAWRVDWQRPAELSVDAGRDSMNEREDVKMGLMTETEHFGRRGRDWRTERVQKEREVDDLLTRAKAMSDKHKIPLPMAIQLLQLSTPNGLQPPKDGAGQSSDSQDRSSNQ